MALLRYCLSSEPSINGYCIFYDENLCAEQTPAGATHCLFSCLEPGFPWNLGLWLQWLLQRSPRGDLYPYWAWEFHKQVEEMLCCSGRVCVSENHWRLFPSQLCSQEALDWLLKLSETAFSPVYSCNHRTDHVDFFFLLIRDKAQSVSEKCWLTWFCGGHAVIDCCISLLSNSWDIFLMIMAGMKLLRTSFCNPVHQFVNLSFTVIFFHCDYKDISESFLLDFFMVSIFFSKASVSVITFISTFFKRSVSCLSFKNLKLFLYNRVI